MPNELTEQQLNNVQYVSMADYLSRVDSFQSFQDKMAFTTRYLLSHGNGDDRDHSLPEAIHIARIKMAEASARLRAQSIYVADATVDPFETNPEVEAANELFFANPSLYLNNEANKLLYKASQEEQLSPIDLNRLDVYQTTSSALNRDPGNAFQIDELDVDSTSRDVIFRLEEKFGGIRGLERQYRATKPGFLASTFGKYSKAYANLDEVYNAFNNPNHTLYGNMNALDKAAIEYLQHRFPNWKPINGLPPLQSIQELSGTEGARALFSYNILKATSEQRRAEQVHRALIDGARTKLANAANGVEEAVEENINQQSFQNNLANEIENEEDVEAQRQAEADYHKNFELDPEEAEEAEEDLGAIIE